MMFFSVEFPHARELWIPAFAGMTDDGVDFRLCGNDGVLLWRTKTATRIFHPSVDLVPGW